MSTQIGSGFAGLQFANDIVYLIKNSWIIENGGEKPEVVTQWNVKTIGQGDSNYSMVIVSIDSENPQIYSMLQGTPAANLSNYDWLHEISITLDIRTGISESRVLEMVNETMRILKTNTVPLINNTQYVQLLPEGTTSLNEEYRNLFRYTISVSAIRFNP
ncbi:MAG: hypothetical protein KGH87_08560 [Thaumarchaeota archaeon]|nr:hypothetical protein [Nitrososphaerota archaeon]